MALFIGLMSGTSLDGVDGVLADVAGDKATALAHAHRPFDSALRAELLALNGAGGNELHRAALAANALARTYAEVVRALLARSGRTANEVRALGAHGQTLRHRPREFDGTGYTIQLMNGALLAEGCAIDVICDFRSRDVAAGGEGAPLVPAFHASCFADPVRDVAVLNLGGIANLTLLPVSGEVRGFDCGPGNALLDLWCQRHRGQPYDTGGAWAASGHVNGALLEACLADPFFDREPPKSTGRDRFNAEWLDTRLPAGLPTADVMATLAELTTRAAGDALRRHAPGTRTLQVCGGGAFNADLLRRLQAQLPGVAVQSTAAAGVAPDQVEALAFAWLASAFCARRTGSLPAVTGARAARVLGALYPA